MKRMAVLLVLVVGCADLFAPMPGDPMLIGPPPQWIHWYHVAEDCSGRTGNVDRVRWYLYPGDLIPRNHTTQRREAAAVTWTQAHKIAIAEAYELDSVTVIHESLHDILGSHGHSTDIFGSRGVCWDALGHEHR
jgi:hypothetical protein